ncbi:TRAP transporter small permease subunit [Roseibacterium sp. SDUM158016]|jgi:TRAP-type mannitol/chloroaromatic compound transport system permease small subunit|uniref:TRAP transporter small permease subunit n=1 Tax=Roseicyclus sediminis TaxID=2980997 RepID=UPI0021D1417D|nr:TRAP transporter small permease subunit [Roseibacterium sp. SDUM158016]MCU4651426.1 TRAP transporter small permease subunit [Roseibacterium sp. SDUM158016]
MTTLLHIARAFALPCHLFAKAAGLMLLILTAVIMYDVIGRRFFNTGSFVVSDLEWHLHGAIAVLCFGYAYIRDAHVRIDIFAHRMSRRLKLELEFWAILVFLIPFMCLLIWFGWDFAARAFERNEGPVGGMGLPNRWIIKAAIPLSAFLTILGALSVALRIRVAVARPDLVDSPFEAE